MRYLDICLPIHYPHLTSRHSEINRLIDALKRAYFSLKTSKRLPLRFHLAINGSLNFSHSDLEQYITNSFKNEIIVNIQNLEKSCKATSINSVIANLVNSIGLLVVDDDITFPIEIFSSIHDYLKHGSQKFELLGFRKYANPAEIENSFQNEYCFLFNISVQRYLMYIIPEYNCKVTGSCYFIPAEKLFSFPVPCNEGEILNNKRYKLSEVPVYSGYPKSLGEEINRRTKHLITNNKTEATYVVKSASFLQLPSLIYEYSFKMPSNIFSRLKKSVLCLKNILHRAQKKYQYELQKTS